MSARSVLGELFPIPFLAVVVLLVVLIFLTPNLVSSGTPAAGSLPTEAELVVDRVVGTNVTHLYVKSLGTVRYTHIAVGIATNVPWPTSSAHPPHFPNATVWNDSLTVAVNAWADPFAVNVSAVYIDAAGVAVDYVGTYAFNVSRGTLTVVPLSTGEATIPPTPVSALPLFILLAAQPAGGRS